MPAPFGMRLLTYSFVALVVPLVAVTRGRPGAARALWAAALATFAVSALHLSQLHRGDTSWPVELVGHHASLPLAFAILYQDYRFALADLFLKRALALLALVAVAFAAIATFGARSVAFARFVQTDPRQLTVLVTLWVANGADCTRSCGEARHGSSTRSSCIGPTTDRFAPPSAGSRRTATTSRALSDAVCELLDAGAQRRRLSQWREWTSSVTPTGASASPCSAGPRPPAWRQRASGEPLPGPAATCVTVPTTDQPRFVLAIGQLSAAAGVSCPTIWRHSKRSPSWSHVGSTRSGSRTSDTTREIREQEIGKLATEAELRALRAQINPHFLFNALTTIGYLIQTAPPRALETLLRLTRCSAACSDPKANSPRSDVSSTSSSRTLISSAPALNIDFASRSTSRRGCGTFAFHRCCSSRSSKTR